MNEAMKNSSRRSFLKHSGAALTGVAMMSNAPAVLGAQSPNESISVGFIGVGNRGSQLLNSFLKMEDARIAAFSDAYEPYLNRAFDQVDRQLRDELGGRVPRMREKLTGEVKKYNDFRRLLEQKDIDAVVIATPDHWHAIQTIQAFDAGKDVYVEKPLSITIHEGRRMVEKGKETGRIAQVGLHRRSAKTYQQIHDVIQSGEIGKVTICRAYHVSNMYPHGILLKPAEKPPEGLDWDMWLGPRPEQDYRYNIAPYKFRWWDLYSSQVANWGVHYFDSMRWALEVNAPLSVTAYGGRYAVDDDRTVPDTMEGIFELPNECLMVFGQYESSGGPAIYEGESEFRGTLANVYSGTDGAGGYNIRVFRPGQFQDDAKYEVKERIVKDPDGDMTDQHVRNFLDCVKSREKPNCDLETGHRSTTFALLANIALATKSRIEWDAEKERITSPTEANEFLHYEYRKPWTL
ncbi:MAG: Gfo/Idh/MocA family protein [bacterium]